MPRREDGRAQQARVVRTVGVPGLNRVMIQMEGSDEAIPAKKRTIELCSWEELEAEPFEGVPLRTGAEERGYYGPGKVTPAGSGDRGGGRSEDPLAEASAPRERNGGGREDRRGDSRRRERGRSGSRSNKEG